VVACLPTAIAAFGRARGYLEVDDCPGRTQPILKRVGAVAGDLIALDSDVVTINGFRLLAQPIEAVDSAARLLPHVEFGSYHVAPGDVWLFGSSSPRSRDGRYFGPVGVSAVRGVVEPVIGMGQLSPAVRAPDSEAGTRIIFFLAKDTLVGNISAEVSFGGEVSIGQSPDHRDGVSVRPMRTRVDTAYRDATDHMPEVQEPVLGPTEAEGDDDVRGVCEDDQEGPRGWRVADVDRNTNVFEVAAGVPE